MTWKVNGCVTKLLSDWKLRCTTKHLLWVKFNNYVVELQFQQSYLKWIEKFQHFRQKHFATISFHRKIFK